MAILQEIVLPSGIVTTLILLGFVALLAATVTLGAFPGGLVGVVSDAREIDGTAHITATLASTGAQPDLVLENVQAAEATADLPLRGRYGYSNVHLDQAWVSRDLVGIDAGAAVLALDNYLMAERVRLVFNTLPCVQAGLHRLGFVAQASAAAPAAPALRIAS